MDGYMTTQELADHLRMTKNALRQWRFRGQGPRYVKRGRIVLYPLAEVARYDTQLAREAGLEDTTSDEPEPAAAVA